MSECKGETPVYRNSKFKDRLLTNLDNSKTVQDVYINTFEKFKTSNYLGERKIVNGKMNDFFTFKTYGEVSQIAHKIGSNILKKDLVQQRQEYRDLDLRFVGLYGKNAMNWYLTDIACCLYNIVSVPIYDTLGEDATKFAFK